jgi:hypothetical protein
MMKIRVAIWRRCLASASRKDRLMAQVRGRRASEVLLMRVWVLRERGTWLVVF